MSKVVVSNHKLCDVEQHLAKDLANLCAPGLIVYLDGDVGAGKTTLVRAILKHLGCTQKVQSPSYSIMNVYDLEIPIVHVDLYRFNAFDAPELLMLDEYMDDAVYFIEWPGHAKAQILPEASITIKINAHKDQARTYELSSPEQNLLKMFYKYS